MTINDKIPDFQEVSNRQLNYFSSSISFFWDQPQRRNQRHGRLRKSPTHSSVPSLAQPASDAQSRSGSAETTPRYVGY